MILPVEQQHCLVWWPEATAGIVPHLNSIMNSMTIQKLPLPSSTSCSSDSPTPKSCFFGSRPGPNHKSAMIKTEVDIPDVAIWQERIIPRLSTKGLQMPSMFSFCDWMMSTQYFLNIQHIYTYYVLMYTLFLHVLAVPTSSKVLVPKQISRRRLLSLHDLTISDLTIQLTYPVNCCSLPPPRPTVIQFHNKILHFTFDKRLGFTWGDVLLAVCHRPWKFVQRVPGGHGFKGRKGTWTLVVSSVVSICLCSTHLERGFQLPFIFSVMTP